MSLDILICLLFLQFYSVSSIVTEAQCSALIGIHKEVINDVCYVFDDPQTVSPMTRADAKVGCTQLPNGHLAIVDKPMIETFYTHLSNDSTILTALHSFNFHTALERVDTSSSNLADGWEWVMTDGSTNAVVDPDLWNTGEPDNSSIEAACQGTTPLLTVGFLWVDNAGTWFVDGCPELVVWNAKLCQYGEPPTTTSTTTTPTTTPSTTTPTTTSTTTTTTTTLTTTTSITTPTATTTSTTITPTTTSTTAPTTITTPTTTTPTSTTTTTTIPTTTTLTTTPTTTQTSTTTTPTTTTTSSTALTTTTPASTSTSITTTPLTTTLTTTPTTTPTSPATTTTPLITTTTTTLMTAATSPCLSSPCIKEDVNAVCTDVGVEFVCTCSANFTGILCDIAATAWEVLDEIAKTVNLSKAKENPIQTSSAVSDSMPFLIGGLDFPLQRNLSWDYYDLIFHCTFAGKTCDLPNDIFQWFEANMGNCFTFNHQNVYKNYSYIIKRAGKRYGLNMFLKTSQDEYLPWTTTAGHRVFIHNQSVTIFAESIGYGVPPGYVTTISLRYNVIKKQGWPYSNCIKDKSELKYYYYSGEYEIDGCYRTCYQNEVYKKCGCMDPRYPADPKKTLCEIKDRNCLNDFLVYNGNTENWDCSEVSNCPLPCLNGIYSATISRTRFVDSPPFCRLFNGTDDQNCKEYIKRNIMKLEVLFEQTAYMIYEEKPKFPISRLFSQLGGQLAFLCGISIISITELIVALIRVLCTVITGHY